MAEDPNTWELETRLVRGGMARSPYGEMSEALFLTQSFSYDSAGAADRRFAGEEPGFVYQRFGNPTTQMLEDRLALLEGAELCKATSSGMSAVNASLMGLLRAGDHLVAGRALFGSCRWLVAELLPRFGVETTFVDATDIDAWKNAVRPNTKAFLVESPANPLLEVTAIGAVCDVAHAAGAKVVVDNVFATPMYQSPLKFGADCVVYSATKHIDGQGRCLGGVILATEKFIQDNVHTLIRQTGPSLSPFNAWVLLKGLETMPVRVARQTETAGAIADKLADEKKVTRLIYPGRPDHPQAKLVAKQMSGGSNLVAFEVAGGKAGAFRFQDALRIVKISNNLGDAKSLITHPATTTHQRLTPDQRAELGISDGLVRLSVGLEHQDDLVDDVLAALKAV